MEITRLSSKGQIVIPQAIRDAHHWPIGLEFVVVDSGDGILLTPIQSFKTTSVQEILGCAQYKGKKKSLEEMNKGIAIGAKKRK